MRPIHPLLLGLVVTSLPAQSGITTTFRSLTDLTAVARSIGGTDRQSFPQNRDLTGGLVLDARSIFVVERARATTAIKFQESPFTGVKIAISESATAQQSARATLGPHASLVTFRAATPVQARLVVSITANRGYSTRPSYSASIDLGNNGTVDLSGGLNNVTSRVFPVTIDANGLAIRITTQGDSGTLDPRFPMTFRGQVQLSLEPLHDCRFHSYGLPCRSGGSPELDGSNSFPRGIELRMRRAAPGAPAVLAIGVNRRIVPLPGNDCSLNIDLDVIIPGFMTDATGGLDVRLPVPAGFVGAVNAQFAVAGSFGNQLRTTMGLGISCR